MDVRNTQTDPDFDRQLIQDERDAHKELMRLANEFPSRHSTLLTLGKAVMEVHILHRALEARGIIARGNE